VRRPLGLVVGAVAAALLAGCGGSSSTPTIDPATTVVVTNEALVRPASSICHVTGNILSIATFRVDVTLKWQAFDATSKVVGTLTLGVNNLDPGESRSFESTGFINGNQGLIDCSTVVSFTRNETDVVKG
jgi:hypothetical protein